MAKGKETVRVIRKARVDKLKPASGPTAEHDVTQCDVIPRISTETDGGTVQITGFTIIRQGPADIRSDDEILVRGELHSVEGTPGVYRKGRKVKATIVTTERVTRG